MKKIKQLTLLCVIPFIASAQWTNTSSWNFVGPTQKGSGIYETGRLDVVVTAPGYNGTTNSTIVVGGSNGGVWRSTDNGANWINIPTNEMRYGGVGDLTYGSDGTLYATDRASHGNFNDRGNGVYKYTGNTWVDIGSYQNGTLVTPLGYKLKSNHLKIHPTNNNMLFLACSAGLYMTADGGSTAWTQKLLGNFENIAFVPNSAATGLYDIYVSGSNKIMKSSNQGASFTDIATPSPNNPFTSYVNPHFDMAYAGLDVDGTSKLIYFYGWVASPTPTYVLYKYKIPAAGSPVMTFVLAITAGSGDYSGPEMERLCIAGDKYSAYFGGDRLIKYNFVTGKVCNPVPVNGNEDISLAAGEFPGYYGSGEYESQIHPDLHDVKIFENVSGGGKIFVAHDGGLSVNNFSKTATNGVYTNNWSYKNKGINIATIWGFSGSETDPDVYATGEQDTKGFVFNEAMTKVVSFGVEPKMVLLDKKKQKNTNGDFTFRLFHNFKLHNSDKVNVDTVNFISSPTLKSLSTYFYETNQNPSVFTPSNTQSPNIQIPQSRMFYQDPVRPEGIYAFAGGIWKFDEATKKFGLKYRTGKQEKNADPLKIDHGKVTIVNSMAVSRTNKNKIYAAANCFFFPPNVFASQIYRYTGPDIDNSWEGHNDTDWEYITPNLRAAPFNDSLTNDEIFNIAYNNLCLSDWDENKLWVIASNPGYYSIPNHSDTKVLMYNNGVWSNFSEGIPEDENPQSMIYERGSFDGLYLATDRNIYYRNAAALKWEIYDNNPNQFVPNLFIEQMEVNYTENTLRAATYGRGIYKTNLKCPAGPLVKNGCSECNVPYSTTNYFWEGTTVSINNTTLTKNKQIVRATNSIDIFPENNAQVTLAPDNANAYYELFIHGCGPYQYNSFKTYQSDSEDIKLEGENEPVDMSVYPNPNNGLFTLNSGTDELKNVYVYDMLGKVVYQKKQVTDKTLEIDIANSPKGLYLIKIVCENETKTIKVVNQ